jgi:hypothetical protein
MDSNYKKHLELLDQLLIDANNSQADFFSVDGFLKKNNIKFTHNKETFEIAEKLYNDGLVKKSGSSSGMDITITPEGREFVAKGGYLGQLNKEEKKESQEIELKNTTIEANKFNIKYYKWNRIFTVINIIILLINLILTYFNFLKK